ncbi:MAG: PH domain-containing protein [Candidatus Saccharibacteria bacterium]|nr:PH domain-containing protein [Candidatus Saccharibacteria bacterium]
MSKKSKTESEKYFDDQLDDEEVLFVFRKHPVVMRKGLILGMLMLLVGTIPAFIEPTYTYLFGGLAAGFVLGIVVFMPAWIAWYYSVFIVTDQRFIQITQRGLFHHSTVDLSLNQIQSINYEVSGFQATVLGYGTILVQTYMGDLVIHDIHHPSEIYKKMLVILRDQGISAASPANAGASINDNEEA